MIQLLQIHSTKYARPLKRNVKLGNSSTTKRVTASVKHPTKNVTKGRFLTKSLVIVNAHNATNVKTGRISMSRLAFVYPNSPQVFDSVIHLSSININYFTLTQNQTQTQALKQQS